MLAAMGVDVGDAGAPWRASSLAWVRQRLSEGSDFRAVVAEVPGDGVVASAIGIRDEHMPGPSSPSGGHGRLFNVATTPAHRRHGHARECTIAVLEWFRSTTDVSVVDLNATPDGEALYRSLGFTPPRFEARRLTW